MFAAVHVNQNNILCNDAEPTFVFQIILQVLADFGALPLQEAAVTALKQKADFCLTESDHNYISTG